jgi:hypothetical protein
MDTRTSFQTYYDQHCKHLILMGLRPKTIEAYSRAIRRMVLILIIIWMI